ncbi:ABC transporter ATP-binding protein [Candidatus Poribacteria bacterium]|nr:ABC transporter ATP-binding protein [Candidatus Poribacteria bacterium]
MLRIQSITASYGKIQALRGVSLHVSPGDIVTLIGANGAGKTTILNTISGLVTAQSGKILFADQNIIGLSPENIVRLGISQVPEGRQIFAPLSVIDNLLLGAYPRYRRKTKQQIYSELDSIFEIFPVLKERRKQLAGTLSGGEQQMLAIGRGLMSKPKLLLLDEPSMGLAPMIVSEIFEIIKSLRERGTTILLVEQNARAALGIADRGYVLETGTIVLQGSASELMENQEVKRAYLGKGYKEVWE